VFLHHLCATAERLLGICYYYHLYVRAARLPATGSEEPAPSEIPIPVKEVVFEAGGIGGGECEDCVLVGKPHLSCLSRLLGVFDYIVRVCLANLKGVDPEIGDVELLGNLYSVLERASEFGFHKTRGCGLGNVGSVKCYEFFAALLAAKSYVSTVLVLWNLSRRRQNYGLGVNQAGGKLSRIRIFPVAGMILEIYL